jgi:hypothetical protein
MEGIVVDMGEAEVDLKHPRDRHDDQSKKGPIDT